MAEITRTLAVALAAVASSILLAGFVLATDAGMEYDDAVYLTRGLYHAAQVSERGNLVLPRLAWSLGFESPKPPLYHGLLAVATLLFGPDHIGAVMVFGTLVPFFAVLIGVFLLARTAAGDWRAGTFAVVLYCAMPSALGFGTRLLTETTLAAIATIGTLFVFQRSVHASVAHELVVGFCAGLSLLTKLLGPLFLGPVILVALVDDLVRGRRWRPVRFTLISGLVAGVMAAPWYIRNGRAALAPASYSRALKYPADLYPLSGWHRVVDFVTDTVGWPILFALIVLVGYHHGGRSVDEDGRIRRRTLGRMVLAATLCSAVLVAAWPVFDPRYWLPAEALLAAWGGIAVADIWTHLTANKRRVLVAAAIVLLGSASYQLVSAARPRMPWHSVGVLGALAANRGPSANFCALGNSPGWNIEKLRLALELSGVRPRPLTTDLLVGGSAVGFDMRLRDCDVVLGLQPEQIPSEPSQRGNNRDLGEAWALLRSRPNEFVRAPSVERELEASPAVEVLIRRSGPT
jgi:hypothetical protein